MTAVLFALSAMTPARPINACVGFAIFVPLWAVCFYSIIFPLVATFGVFSRGDWMEVGGVDASCIAAFEMV